MSVSGILRFIFVAISLLLFSCVDEVDVPLYENSSASVNERVSDLLERMTLEEKLGQLYQRHIDTITHKDFSEIIKGHVGSVLNGLDTFYLPAERNELQRAAVEKSRLGIPLLFGHDAVHGFQTIFPLSLAQSCTWSPELVEKASKITAKEAAAYGIDWTFAPMVDVSRDARWGRVAECYGEDPYLNTVFGLAAIRGFQGNKLTDSSDVVACLKHFVGYSASIGGRDYQYTGIPDRDMHEIYLKPFEAGVKAGAMTVMSAFNDINGVPASANQKYLGETLRREWGFEGFVVSDWDAVVQLINHGIAEDSLQASLKALMAGVDMEMKSETYKNLKSIAHDKEVINSIDDAVRRVLRVKFKKGLFEQPYINTDKDFSTLAADHRELARKIASHSMVLIKNEKSILPLTEEIDEIAVLGPFAHEHDLMGWWKSLGKRADLINPFQGLANNAFDNLQVNTQVTGNTDAIIVCLGETREMFGEYHSRASITIPNDQLAILKSLEKYSLPVITVLFNGRPLALKDVLKSSRAVLLAWHPGTEAGNALADVIYGTHNPSGRLTMSFPKVTGQVPLYYNHRNSGRPHQADYIDVDAEPLFPFGFGLSYTEFEYSNLNITDTLLGKSDSTMVSVTIKNTGDKDGYEVAQLYIRDKVGSSTRPVKELKSFKKVLIKKGEEVQVKFVIHSNDLMVYDEGFNLQFEPGEFSVWIAPDSESGDPVSFSLLE